MCCPVALRLPGLQLCERRYCYRFATFLVREKYVLCVNSEHIALPIFLLRYDSHGAGSAQRAASRRRPLYSRALAAKIATSWYLRLIPAFRERLIDFEATNTGGFSQHGE